MAVFSASAIKPEVAWMAGNRPSTTRSLAILSRLSPIVVVTTARILLKVKRASSERIAAEKLVLTGCYHEWAMPTHSIARFLVITVAAILVFPYFPCSGSEGFKGVSVFLWLLVPLGVASAIANVIAGIVIVYMRRFHIGDRAKIADTPVDFIGKDLFVARLHTIKNIDITIPNSFALANHIVNFSAVADGVGSILHTSVAIGYDAPWRIVHELLLTAARKVDGVKPEPSSFVLQTSHDDFYVSYELNVYADRPRKMAAIYSKLPAEIQDAFNSAGVEIMSPHYASVRDGNNITIPDEYLPKNYRAPEFGIVARLAQTARDEPQSK